MCHIMARLICRFYFYVHFIGQIVWDSFSVVRPLYCVLLIHWQRYGRSRVVEGEQQAGVDDARRGLSINTTQKISMQTYFVFTVYLLFY